MCNISFFEVPRCTPRLMFCRRNACDFVRLVVNKQVGRIGILVKVERSRDLLRTQMSKMLGFLFLLRVEHQNLPSELKARLDATPGRKN
ncbi:hypothetical protein ACOME3_004402 [Neoechinorhynchus agilis]